MNETDEEGLPADSANVNPYDSPGIEAQTETASDEVGEISPSRAMLSGGLGLGVLLQMIAIQPEVTYYLNKTPQLLAWSVPQFLQAVVVGLGIALFGDAWRHRRFSALMPGHWCLIAYIPMVLSESLIAIYNFSVSWIPGRVGEVLATSSEIVVQLGMVVTAILITAFFCAVLKTTREQTTWKVYAFSSMCSWLFLMLAGIARYYGSDEVSQLANTVVSALAGLSYLAATITFVVSIILDYTRKRPRDIYHWLGVILMIAMPIASMLFMLVPQTFYAPLG